MQFKPLLLIEKLTFTRNRSLTFLYSPPQVCCPSDDVRFDWFAGPGIAPHSLAINAWKGDRVSPDVILAQNANRLILERRIALELSNSRLSCRHVGDLKN